MTHVVSALFGAMVALLIYTRLGGMATTLTAGAILVGYIVWESWRSFRDWRMTRAARRTSDRRFMEWRDSARG